jgi:hypothetical protein
VAYGLLPFLAADRLNWLWSWAQLPIIGGCLADPPLFLIPTSLELLAGDGLCRQGCEEMV